MRQIFIQVGKGCTFSNDVSIGVYGGYSVTFENLQLAVHMGLNPIYLIGCDHYYQDEPEVDPHTRIEVGVEANHFISRLQSRG